MKTSELKPKGDGRVRSSEIVVPSLITKWREHAKEAARDLGAAMARHNDKLTDGGAKTL